MKKSDIQLAIDTYHLSSGMFRKATGWKESHLLSLEKLMQQLKDGELLPDDLVRVAKVIIEKKDREGVKASSKIFLKLAEQLGGYDALDLLNQHNMLKGSYLEYLERYATKGSILAAVLVELKGRITDNAIEELLSAIEFRTDNSTTSFLQLLEGFRRLFMKPTGNFIPLIDIIKILNTAGMHTDAQPLRAIIYSLHTLSVAAILQLKDMIAVLARYNRELITPANIEVLKTITGTRLPTLVPLFASLHTHSQENLNVLTGNAPEDMEKLSWIGLIIKLFNPDEFCDVTPYLQDILLTAEPSNVLIAVSTLKAGPREAADLPRVLASIFLHPGHSPELARAYGILCEAYRLNDTDWGVVSRYPEHAGQVAQAIKNLRACDDFPETILTVACQYAAHADGVSQYLIEWHRLYGGANRKEPRQHVLDHPETAAATARMLSWLHKNNRVLFTTITSICDAGLQNDALLHLLKAVKKAGLLDQGNLTNLLKRHGKAELLAEAFLCLGRGGAPLQTQLNLESLMADPDKAVELALNLGGKAKPAPVPEPAPEPEVSESKMLIAKRTPMLATTGSIERFFGSTKASCSTTPQLNSDEEYFSDDAEYASFS